MSTWFPLTRAEAAVDVDAAQLRQLGARLLALAPELAPRMAPRRQRAADVAPAVGIGAWFNATLLRRIWLVIRPLTRRTDSPKRALRLISRSMPGRSASLSSWL